MIVKKLGQHWWIISDEYGMMGPYDTKSEANSDKKGIAIFQKSEDNG